MLYGFDNFEKIIAVLFSLLCMFGFVFFIYVLSTKTPYDTMINSCESIGYFYINENVSIECKVLRK